MGKVIFNKLNFLTIGVCTIITVVFFCIGVSEGTAQRQISYKTYDPQSGEVSDRFTAYVEDIPTGGYKIHWVIEENGFKVEEDYILGPDHETLWWHVVDDQRKTDYIGERKKNELFIDGEFAGARIQKIIQLDGKVFYYNPKVGLVDFVLSGKEAETFWGFRQDELKVYPMKAINMGTEVISVDGSNVEAVKVDWTVNDFRSFFFKRTYWFRKSDGLYIKQMVDGGKFRELTSER